MEWKRGSGLKGVWLGKLGAGSSGDSDCCVVVFLLRWKWTKVEGGFGSSEGAFCGGWSCEAGWGITGMQISILFLCICECFLVFCLREQCSFSL